MVLADQPDTGLLAVVPDSHQLGDDRVAEVFSLPGMDSSKGLSSQAQRLERGRVHRQQVGQGIGVGQYPLAGAGGKAGQQGKQQPLVVDRKSTRLNSSHVRISYAVFCLKKKKKQTQK